MTPTAQVVHHGSTLCLNTSNSPLIPEEGLVLPADSAVEVPGELLDLLSTIPSVEVLAASEDPEPNPA
jgi:hypothetical protein